MSRGSIASRHQGRPSTAGSAPSEDSIATTVEIVERATCTLQGLRTADALRIWRALGSYLQDQLAQRRPVRVEHFGVFGLNESAEPVFLAEASFLQANRVRERERNGQVLSTRFAPVARVSAHQIGAQYLSKCRKEVVAAVIAGVVALVGKWAKQGSRRGLRLGFLPVGEWQCDSDGVVSFRFLAEFRKHLRLGTTGVTAAQVAASGGSRGGDEDGRSCRTGTNSPRGGSLSVPSTTSKANKLAGRSRPGDGCWSPHKSLDGVRGAERASNGDLTSEAKAVGSIGASVSSHRSSVPSRRSNSRGIGAITTPPRPSTSATSIARSASSGKTVATGRRAWAEPRANGKADAVFARVRAKLALRCGTSGLNALERALQPMAQANISLTRRELKFALRDLGVEVSATELGDMVGAMAGGGERDHLRLDSIVSAFRGATPLPASRRVLIERAFRLMDVAGRGAVTLDDLKGNYDVSALPKVRSGKQSPNQALAAFIREWEPAASDNNAARSDNNKKVERGSSDGDISLDSFVRYYHNVSACVADDGEFERMMRQLWHVSLAQDDDECPEDVEGHNSSQSEADTRDTELSHSQMPNGAPTGHSHEVEGAWQYLETLLLPKKWSRGAFQTPTLDEMCHRIGANRVLGDGNEVIHTRAFAHALTHLDKRLETHKTKYLASLAAEVGSNQAEQDDVIYLAELYKLLRNAGAKDKHRAGGNSNLSGSKSNQVIDKVRQRLLRRVALSSTSTDNNGDKSAGVTFHGLSRSLRLMDTDGDRRLSKDELKAGLCKFGVDVNFHEVDCLFAFFDTDQSGCISCDEFVSGMRGEMSARRLALVQQAFALLDTDGDGQLTLKELQAAYDCSKHPEVISGKMTAEDAIRVFASQWEVDQPDGIITCGEFEAYYKNLSASIDLDDYFELMMRNAWHISGGEGQCANSTNRRLQLTDADGSERVVEIRNDLGVKATDFARMRANLQAQGLLSGSAAQGNKPADIQLFGSSDSCDKTTIGATKQARRTAPDRRFHRRSQFAQPDSDGRSFLAMAETNRAGARHDLDQQRSLRARAAELIQARFRGHRARKLVAIVRRKTAVERQRRDALEKEQASASKRRVLRAATRTVHGF